MFYIDNKKNNNNNNNNSNNNNNNNDNIKTESQNGREKKWNKPTTKKK